MRGADAAALTAALIAGLALLGYLFDVPALRRGLSSPLTPMALPTALAMLSLSAGLIAANTGLAVLARGRGPGGALLRRLAPAAVIVPVALTFVTLEGLRSDWFEDREGLALLGAALIVVLALLVIFTASRLERVRRRELAIIDATVDAVITLDAEGRVREFNAAAERMFGFRRDAVIGKELAPLVVPEALREAHRSGLARAVARGESTIVGRPVELTAMRADGSEFPAEITISRLSGDGRAVFVGHVRDITARLESERAARHLAAVVESSADAIVAVGMDGAVTSWNAAAQRIYGYPREEAVGRHIEELVVPPERHAEMPEVGAELMSGRSIHDESIHMRRDGGRFPAEATTSPIRDAEGEIAGFSLIARDITGRREAERAVRRLAAIVESSSDAIYTFQLDGAVLSWNKGAERTLGYEAAEIAGRSVVILSNAGPDAAQVHEFFAALNRGETVEREAIARRKDGEAINLAYTAFPIRDDHGALLAGGMIARDVTEQRRLEEQLRQAQKMEAVGQLAGGIAHDFNNLLTVITGYGQLARALVGAGNGASELEAIERAAARATELTRQLLAFSRRQRLDPVVLDLSEVARGLAPMLRRLIGDDIEVEMALADALPEVLADAGQLEQVVINLAVNARDAMPEGGLLVVATGVEGDHVWLSVSDTGIGIAPEALPHVFEPFYTTKPVGAGTGLGLASVHGAITQSGGRIEVDSEPGHGTTFKFLLPATRAERDAAVPERPASEDWLGGDETILVCEDEDGVRALVELVLAGAGYRVLSEGRPSAALARAEGEPGHIHGLVTDVIMPDMPGPELARRLGGSRPGLRTLFISGYTADTVRERGSLPAGSAFLEKPFDRTTLLRTLRELLTTT